MTWVKFGEGAPQDQAYVVIELSAGLLIFGRFMQGQFCEYDLRTDRYYDVAHKHIKYWFEIPGRSS